MKTIGSFFKSFAVYSHNIDRVNLQMAEPMAEDHPLEDPGAGSWGTRGLVAPFGGQLFHSLEGMGELFCVQFNERMLPAKVVAERMSKRIADIQDREGRKIGKKEFAQLRDDVHLELLPQAFIKRAKVYGLITTSKLVIFTGSAKRQDDTVLSLLYLLTAIRMNISFTRLAYALRDPVIVMTGLAIDEDDRFSATNVALLKAICGDGPDATIRVKDKDIYGNDVQTLLKKGFRVHELGLRSLKHSASFTLAKSMTVKAFRLADDLVINHFNESAEDFHGAAWLVCRTALDVWSDIEKSFEDDEL